jgi:hypothetical protein
MEYLIPLVIVLLLVGGFVAFLVMNATRRGQSASDRGESGPPGIGQDETPLGDTSQHAGRQTDEGQTVAGQDAGEAGGTGQPVQSGYEGTSAVGHDDARESAHVRRSGEGEGTEAIAYEDVRPPAAERTGGERAQARAGDQAGGEAEEPVDAGPGESAQEREAEGAQEREAAAPADPEAAGRADDDRADDADRPDEQRGGDDAEAERPASERLADRGF